VNRFVFFFFKIIGIKKNKKTAFYKQILALGLKFVMTELGIQTLE
jgi:hypothetical protein